MYEPIRRTRSYGYVILAAMLFFDLLGFDPNLASAADKIDDGGRNPSKMLLERAGIRRGLCVVLASDAALTVKLARSSELFIHVRTPEGSAVERLRKRAEKVGLGIDRLAVEHGSLERLPYADNMVDIVISSQLDAEKLASLSPEEVLRVLRPEGTTILGAPKGTGISVQALKRWASSQDVGRIQSWEDSETAWIQFHKPALAGVDEWTHWEHGPDNNPVSSDSIIKAPYMTQFMAEPYYIGMPSITTAAGGRTFLAIGHIAHHRREWGMLNKLIARNGYNGTVLWERNLPEGYLVHRSSFIASKEIFYLIDGDRCLLLDSQTGEEKGEIRIPGLRGQWKWMVMEDGILYVLAGKRDVAAQITKGDRSFGGWSWADLSRGYYGKTGNYVRTNIPWGFGDSLAAYDLDRKNLIWKHSEEEPIDSRGISMGGGKLFLYCPTKHLRCLDTTTGRIIWTNDDATVLDLIEERGRGLVSTPGFKTASLAVYTPDAIIIQGQARMNVIAVSTDDGYLLWTKKKFTNNPNAIYVDGNVVLGVGPRGSHVVIDPVSGKVLEDLKFLKRACTRLTASTDSFFVRGEGVLRYDRNDKKIFVDGSVRPACNDGALPANGMLYLGPWQCDCNLSLIGFVARCSAGDFRFDYVATEADRLELGEGNLEEIAPLPIAANDWPTYRADNHRTASTKVRVPEKISRRWEYIPQRELVPCAPVSAGGLVFVCGEDGKIRALDSKTGQFRWEFSTPSPIKQPPTISEGRAYFGSGDGYAYALEAATGRLLWRFRAAPIERHIMLYGNLNSTWPVNSGVLVQDGIAYFGAGIIDYDGTYLYALDAKTGKIEWQNNSAGHLSPGLRKGVSVQGNLTVQGDRLLLASGNQVSPAPFDLSSGKFLGKSFDQGAPKANAGKFVGVFADRFAIAGGRLLYSAPQNVSTKGSFVALTGRRPFTLNYGGIPPAWDENTLAMVNFKSGKLTCCSAEKVAARMSKGYQASPQADRRGRATLSDLLQKDGAVLWQSDLGESNKFEAISLAVCPNVIVAVVQHQQKARSQPQWFVVALDAQKGKIHWRQEMLSEPLPGGLLVDRDGQVVVTMLDGKVLCLGQDG